MDNDVMVKVEHVSKQYRLGMIGGTTLREEMQRKLAQLKGKDDPTRKLGEQNSGKTGELFYALDDVSFEVKKGEAVGIIGHNGAGKSTILKLISQVTGPTTGSIELNGRVASMLEVGTGFHPELSGRENIYMNGAILGMTKAEIDSKIEDIIDFSECRQFIDTPVKRYSSGMYVKLAFSVAAHLESEIMIMDEVLAVGDAKFQEKCLGRMGDEAHGGRTVLYVSHNMNTIRTLCDRVIVLDHGRKVFDGDVEQEISIYNGLKDLSSNVVELAQVEREPAFRQHRYTLERLRVQCDNGQYEFGSHIKGWIEIGSPDERSNMGLFWLVHNMSGTPLIQMDTKESITLHKGNNVVPFDIDVSPLVPGKYYATLSLMIKNTWETREMLDNIHNAYCFEILANEQTGRLLNRDPFWFGYLVGSDISIQ